MGKIGGAGLRGEGGGHMVWLVWWACVVLYSLRVGGGGIFEKLQATADPGALTRSRQKPCGCKNPAFLV